MLKLIFLSLLDITFPSNEDIVIVQVEEGMIVAIHCTLILP